jgi:CheY-like chemotaxis protein
MAKKILIIDDDPMIVKYLLTLFSDSGYDTCTASDGVQALEVVQTANPDLITLDLEMPHEWGSRFYRKLSKDENLKKIPIIVISGLSGGHAVKDAVAFVKKPFDPEKLLGIVKKTIG